jgi:hypothetical protein
MTEKQLSQQDINDQISDLTEMAEQRDIKLTPEVSEYLHDGMEKVLDKLQSEEDQAKILLKLIWNF